jgi:hypothetical protein
MISLLAIDERHKRLYRSFLRKREKVEEGFEEELRQLLNEITQLSRRVPSMEDYEKLCEFVEEWKAAGALLSFNVNDIFLIPPDHVLQTTPDQPKWTDLSMDTWIRTKAHELSKDRALEWYIAMPFDEIVQRFRDNLSHEERDRQSQFDWAQAELYLAIEVLTGNFDLTLSFTQTSYWRLTGTEGQMWLRRAKNLMAYQNWKARGGGWGAEAAERDYLNVCDEFNNMLLNPHRKAPQSAFEQIRRFLESEFLDDAGKLDLTNENKKAQVWLQTKANRLLETGYVDHIEQARIEARNQMVRFYENITRAVMGADPTSSCLVLEALGLVPKHEMYEAIVNCFEMILAIYFLDAHVAKTILDHSHGLNVARVMKMAAGR